MAITEKSRNELRTYLEDTMGEERATTLMEHLPPVGWADVATRQDLDQLRTATRQDLDHLREILDYRFEAVRAHFESVATQAQPAELHRDLRSQTIAFMALSLTLFGLVVTVLKLA